MKTAEEMNWIVETGQGWKLYVAIGGFGASLGSFTLALFSLAERDGRFMALVACGLFLGVATFAWFTAALRCPHCLAKLVWTMAATRPHSSWIIDLAALERCPQCRARLTDGKDRRG